MASLGELFVTVGAKVEGFTQAMSGVSATLDKVDAKANSATSGFDKLASKLNTLGMGLTASVTAPIAGLGLAVANVAGTLEQTETAFANFLGGAEKAAVFLQQLKDFAAATPFEFGGLTDSAKKMLAFGFEAEKIIPMLRTIGDAVAGIGGGAAEIDRVTLALGQMQAKGKVSAQEMNQLAELGIPAWKMLAEQIGVSIPEAMKLAERGAISASVAVPAILDGMNQKFGGLMDQQSKTLLGQWSNFKDQVTFTLMDIGKVLLPIFKDMLQAAIPLVEAVKNLAAGFAALPGPVQTAILGMTALAAAMGPLLLVGGQLITVFTTITKAMPMIVAGGVALTGAFANITTALQLGMVGALTAAETALLAVSVAVGGVIALFAGWQIGSWAYKNIPAVKELGDTIADVALIQIPYLENALMKLTGVTSAQTKASGDLDFATAKLEKSLKAKGVVVDRGTMSADEYAAALRAKAKELTAGSKASDTHTTATKKTTDAQVDAKKAAEQLARAYTELGLRNHAKDADELSRAIDTLKRSGDWNKLSIEQQQQALDRLADAKLKVTGYTYDWQRALIGLTTTQDSVRRNTEAMFDSMEQVGAGIQGVTQDIRDMPMGQINEELMSQAEAAMRAAGEIHALENAYNKADLKNKNAIYEMLRDQIEAAEEAGETVPREQREMLEKMEKDLGRGGKLDNVKGAWGDFSREVSTIITNFAQSISDSLWDGDLSWGEKGKRLLTDLGKAVTSLFITPAISAITDFVKNTLEGLLGGALDGIAKKFGGIFGGGSSSGGGDLMDWAIGNGWGGGGSTPSTPGTGSAGGGMGGVAGAVGLASGIVGAVSAVIGNFQMAKQETTLNAIEDSTRYTKGYLRDLLPKLTNDFAAVLPSINDRLIELRQIGIAVWPKEGYEDAFKGGGGVTIQIQGNVIGTDDAAQTFADIIAAKLATQGAV